MSLQEEEIKIHTTEMHTGGHPVRIITEGYPPIPGKTILEKRRYVKAHLDHFRTLLMHEPRGHFDMYGALLVPPDHPEADIGVLFLHNEGYSSMCGHAVIALTRYVVENNISVKSGGTDIWERRRNDLVEVAIQCPCGLVRANAKVEGKRCTGVSFVSVPAFSFANDITINTAEFGDVVLDVGYGGAFYALVEDKKLNISLEKSSYEDIIRAATVITEAVKKQLSVEHPEEEDLSFLYGTIVTDGKDAYDAEKPTKNVCIFADRQTDRSPTGSGVTARVAVQFSKGLIKTGQSRTFANALVNSQFQGKAEDARLITAVFNLDCERGIFVTREVSCLNEGQTGQFGMLQKLTDRFAVLQQAPPVYHRVLEPVCMKLAKPEPVQIAKCGKHDAVQVEVTGNAYYVGKSVFTVEKDDPLKYGFLVK